MATTHSRTPLPAHQVDEPARAEAAPARASAGRGETTLILFCGAGLALCGLALALGPKVSWKLGRVAEGLSDLGLHSGTLVTGGLVLAAMALLLRAPATAHAGGDRQDSLLMEQAATDLLQTRRLCEEIERNFQQVCERIDELQVAGRPSSASQAAPSQDQQEAIFRLAASLDQVGARIEQRLKAQHGLLQERLEKVVEAIVAAHDSLEHRLGEASTREEPAAEAAGIDAAQPEPEAPPETASLGLLDLLDDERPHSPSFAAEAKDAMVAANLAAAPACLPAQAQPATEAASDLTLTKLRQLSTLLSDEELRAALQQIRL